MQILKGFGIFHVSSFREAIVTLNTPDRAFPRFLDLINECNLPAWLCG